MRDSDIAIRYASHPAAFSRQNDSVGVGEVSLTREICAASPRPHGDSSQAGGASSLHRGVSPGARTIIAAMRYLVAVCLLATNVCLAQTPPAAAKPQPT